MIPSPYDLELAHDLGKSLKDWASYDYYLDLVKKYPRLFLVNTIFYVQRVPEELIQTNRAHLFKSIIRATHTEHTFARAKPPRNLPKS